MKPHAARLPSGARGVSLAFLRAVRDFYAARGGLGQVMGDICKKGETSVCSLTRSTGLSLAESVVLTVLFAVFLLISRARELRSPAHPSTVLDLEMHTQ